MSRVKAKQIVLNQKGDIIVGGNDGASDILPIGQNNQILTVDNGNLVWKNPTSLNSLSALNDVSVTDPLNGQLLTYNENLAKWENIENNFTLNDGVRVTNSKFDFKGDGPAIEVGYVIANDWSVIQSFDRTTTEFKPLKIRGSAINFETSGIDRVAISESGNIGISNSDPKSLLTVGTSIGVGYAATFNANTAYGAKIRTIESSATSNPALWVSTAPGTSEEATTLFRVQNNGRVGIGTDAPDSVLHVEGKPNITAGIIQGEASRLIVGYDGTGDNYFDGGSHSFRNFTGKTHLFIGAEGKVGIGTETPDALLVVSDVSSELQARFGTFAPGKSNFIRFQSRNTDDTNNYYADVRIKPDDNVLAISSPGTNAGNITETLFLKEGNVGIGTAVPEARLQVSGKIALSGQDTFKQDSVNPQIVRGNGGYIMIGAGPAGGSYSHIDFYTQGTEKARIDPDGNLLVGTTTTSGIATGASSNPGTMLRGASIPGIAVQANGNNCVWLSKAPGYNSGNFLGMYVANTQVGLISTDGTTVTYGTSSDYRLKEIEGPVTDSGAFIDSLKPCRGVWKSTGEPFVGFVAHELQEVSPSSVTGYKDEVDEDGNPVIQSVDPSSSEIMANLVAEIQALRKRVADLEEHLST